MLIGMRNAMLSGGWKNPYVTDGLIAMWDGEWNAGPGVHDPNATVWKDLVGTRDATLSGKYEWTNNAWRVYSVSEGGLARWDGSNLGSDQTIEFVIKPTNTSSYGRIMAEAQAVASPCLVASDASQQYMFGYGIDRTVGRSGNMMKLHSHCISHPSGGPLQWWVDGVMVATSATSADSTGATTAYFANRSAMNRGIDAEYYCVRLNSRALTAAEIAHNYAVDKARFNLPTT